MATLSANSPRKFLQGLENLEYPVIASDIIYEGAAVGLNGSGYARPLVAGDTFIGIAIDKVDNSSGAAGDKQVLVKHFGIVELTLASAAADDEGKTVYASDDDTFTLTSSTNSRIGVVHKVTDAANNKALVKLDGGKGLEQGFYVFAAGEFTTAGGDTDETITVSGALATDLCIVTMQTAGAVPVTIIDASVSAGQIDVDMSADPSTDHVLTYLVLRARV